jgi:AcrR family transcriptional regulator
VIKDDAPVMADTAPDLRRHLRTPRGRIFDGMAQAVAERGYGATAVADVLDRCQMSRRTFYQHFPNKEECFLAAYDFAIEHLATDVMAAVMAAGPAWHDQVRRGFQTFMAYVVAEPAFARLCLVEVLAAGPRGLERRAAAVARFTGFLQTAAERAPGRPVVPPTLPEAIVGGVQSVISSRLLNGRAAELPDLLDDLLFWGLVPFLGHQEAGRTYTVVS